MSPAGQPRRLGDKSPFQTRKAFRDIKRKCFRLLTYQGVLVSEFHLVLVIARSHGDNHSKPGPMRKVRPLFASDFLVTSEKMKLSAGTVNRKDWRRVTSQTCPLTRVEYNGKTPGNVHYSVVTWFIETSAEDGDYVSESFASRVGETWAGRTKSVGWALKEATTKTNGSWW